MRAETNNTQGDFQMDHLRDCIIGQRPEMLPMGECFGGCVCECHKIYEEFISVK